MATCTNYYSAVKFNQNFPLSLDRLSLIRLYMAARKILRVSSRTDDNQSLINETKEEAVLAMPPAFEDKPKTKYAIIVSILKTH